MTPSEILLLTLLVFVAVQLFFLVVVFGRLIFYSPQTYEVEQAGENQGVSVIICAWNELDNLQELLPLLESQDYSEYEVIVVNDRSSDGTTDFLETYCAGSERVRTVYIKDEYEHITPKKYAVTIGQKHAKYPVALMTDADCRPTGSGWISSMVSKLGGEKEIVLGFSPYFREKGLLNWFIRTETFYTAVQYFSFASYGLAYMGVGRNLMYKRSLFFANRGFYTHSNVLGGDDDLFINEVATFRNTTCSLSEDSHMYSVPKKTWGEWFTQKTRHLGVGKHYKSRFKFLLGLLAGSHVFTWLITVTNIIVALILREQYLLIGTLALFGGRWLIQWVILGLINSRLGNTVSSFLIPLMDFALFGYYLIMGGYNMFRKQRVTKWR